MAALAAVTVLVLGQSAARQAVDRAFEAHRKLKSAGIAGSFQATSPVLRQSIQMRLDFTPTRMTLKLDETIKGRSTTRRLYALGSDFRAFDLQTRESVRRKLIAGKDWSNRFLNSSGSPLPDLPRFFLSQQDAPTLLGSFRNAGNLSYSTRNGVTTLFQRNGLSMVTMTLGRDGLMRTLSVQSPQGSVAWKLSYRPTRFASLPGGFTSVEAFTELPTPPRYETKEAQRLGEQMLRAQANFTRGVVLVRQNGRETRLAFDGRKCAVRGPEGEWAYDGRVLDVRSSAGRRKGRSLRREIPGFLEKLGLTLDPFLRPRLFGRIGFRDILPSEARVRIAGKVSMAGKQCQILESRSPSERFTAFVTSEGIVMSLTVENIRAGKVLNRSQRDYQIVSRGTALSPAEFSLRDRRGESVLPFKR